MAEVVERNITHNGQSKLLATDQEYTISLIGLIASFCGQPIVGLILTIIALKESKHAGRHNTYALVGFIISLVALGLWALFILAYFAMFIVIFAVNGSRF